MQENIKDLFLQEFASLGRSFLLKVVFSKHYTEYCHKEAVKIHELPKKTGNVGEKLSSGHKRENQIEKCSREFFRIFFILFVTFFAIEGT